MEGIGHPPASIDYMGKGLAVGRTMAPLNAPLYREMSPIIQIGWGWGGHVVSMAHEAGAGSRDGY
jgi:hypothetical protein